MTVWEKMTLEANATLRQDVGPLRLWIRRDGDEWHIAAERDPRGASAADEGEARGDPDVPTEGLEWRRWVVGEKTDTVLLKPAMPDRPIVVRPEYPVRLPPKHHALFYVSIPIWVQVTVDNTDLMLCEEPALPLSNTWFGDYAAGKLCYSLTTRARRSVEAADERPHRARCPVMVANQAQTELDFQRLCIHVSHLRIENRNNQLWTNQVNVTFRGEDEASRIEYAKEPAQAGGSDVLLAEPRTPLAGSIMRWSFGGLRFLNFTQ